MDTATATVKGMDDGTRGFDFYGIIWDYLVKHYLTNPFFVLQIILVIVLIVISRVFIFDNRKVEISPKSMLYPAVILVSCALAVTIAELTDASPFYPISKFASDLIISTGILFLLYGIALHKLVIKISSKVNYNYTTTAKPQSDVNLSGYDINKKPSGG